MAVSYFYQSNRSMPDRMEAREYFDLLKDEGEIIRVAKYDQDKCIGRGTALIIDKEHQVAVMLIDCGSPKVTKTPSGCLVSYVFHPEGGEDQYKLVGSTAGPAADPSRLTR